jgi:hypothetical protein
VLDAYITQVEVLDASLSTTMRTQSRIRKMRVLHNAMSPLLPQSPIMCPDRIEELTLFDSDRSLSLKLPSLVHINLIGSFDALNSCPSVSMNLQSITIVMHQPNVHSAMGHWTDLRVLNTLPRLHSVRVLMYDILVCPDDVACQIFAETSLTLHDFGISFRERCYQRGYDRKSLCDLYRSFIKQLHQIIVCLSTDQRPQYAIEENGCGLIVWR